MTQFITADMVGAFWELEKGAVPLSGSLEQPASVDTENPLSGGCFCCGGLLVCCRQPHLHSTP